MTNKIKRQAIQWKLFSNAFHLRKKSYPINMKYAKIKTVTENVTCLQIFACKTCVTHEQTIHFGDHCFGVPTSNKNEEKVFNL